MDSAYVREFTHPPNSPKIRFRKPSISGTWTCWWRKEAHIYLIKNSWSAGFLKHQQWCLIFFWVGIFFRIAIFWPERLQPTLSWHVSFLGKSWQLRKHPSEVETKLFAVWVTLHILGDRLIPEQLLWVDRGILHVGPTKSLTFSPGDPRVAMGK